MPNQENARRVDSAGIRVLIVDDYPDAADALALLLEGAGFSVTALRDPRDASNNLSADTNGNVVSVPLQLDADNPPLLRVVSFGSRDWTLIYYAKVNVGAHAQEVAAIVLAIGAALTTILCGLFGYVSYNNIRLSREIETRIGFERRLTAVIDELNHRVKNILAVIQSIVTRTLRHGADVPRQRVIIGWQVAGEVEQVVHVVHPQQVLSVRRQVEREVLARVVERRGLGDECLRRPAGGEPDLQVQVVEHRNLQLAEE